jgi:hypothetical protein
MKLRLLPASALVALLAACGGTSPATTTTTTTGSGGGAGTGGGGGTGGATPSCADATSLPTMACGTLGWTKSDTLSRPRNHHFTAVAQAKAGAFLYAIGGADGNSVLDDVDRAPVAADGSVGAFTAEAKLPLGAGGLTGAVLSNVIVIAGGMTGGGVTNKSFSAVIGDDGALGAWTPAGSVLHPRMHPGSFTKGTTMYVLGGFNDPTVWDDAVSATVSADGTVSAWASAGKLPAPRSHMSVSYVDGYVFLTGGLDKSAFSNPPFLAESWRGHVADDGTLGEWTAMPALPAALATHASFFYGGYLYVGGGINSTPAQEKRMWRAPIGADHVLGAWEKAAPLLIARGHVHQFPLFNAHVYSVAGAIDFNLASTTEIDVGSFQ